MSEEGPVARLEKLKASYRAKKSTREQVAEHNRRVIFEQQREVLLRLFEAANDSGQVTIPTSQVSDETKKWFEDRGVVFEASYLPEEDHYFSNWVVKFI
jgi:hypothetical protein